MDGCPYCDLAKKVLTKRQQKSPDLVNLKIDKGAENTNPEIKKKLEGAGINTWPRIFLNNKFFGGYSDLEKYINENK